MSGLAALPFMSATIQLIFKISVVKMVSFKNLKRIEFSQNSHNVIVFSALF